MTSSREPSHHLGQHIIEFVDRDHATGVVYSKNEHECGAEWVIMQMLYWDDYERIDGQWYFRRRLPCYWYATDLNKPPIGDMKMRWPGRETLPWRFPRPVPELEGILGPAPRQRMSCRRDGRARARWSSSSKHAPWHTCAAHACALKEPA